MSDLLLTYFADDLTGATDVLEQLASVGVRAALFFAPPDAEALRQFPDLQAIGVAGTTRSLGPQELELELRPALAALAGLGAPYCHYKVCSTFDSAPTRGSIGRALDVARNTLQPRLTAILGGNPPLARYCAFGNLFAAASVAGAGEAFRLDRHPTVSRHPATPMTESDLRAVLAAQTAAKIGLFDLRIYSASADEQAKRLEALLNSDCDAVLFDAVEEDHLDAFAALIDARADKDRPALLIGSSAVETALCRRWAQTGQLHAASWSSGQPHQVVVGTASCSPVTASQIDWAVRAGFGEVALDAPAVASGGADAGEIDRAADQAFEHLSAGRNVVIHAAKGPADARIAATLRALPGDGAARSGELLGRAIGRLVERCLQQAPAARVCLAGGDTSSFAARELGIRGLEMVGPFAPGAPVCRAWAPGRAADRVEFAFKGGQVGGERFFEQLSTGRKGS